MSAQSITASETGFGNVHRGSGMAPTVGFLGAERVLQGLRGVRGQDDATETGRRATPQRIIDIVKGNAK